MAALRFTLIFISSSFAYPSGPNFISAIIIEHQLNCIQNLAEMVTIDMQKESFLNDLKEIIFSNFIKGKTFFAVCIFYLISNDSKGGLIKEAV
jgi:hypothetical protein